MNGDLNPAWIAQRGWMEQEYFDETTTAEKERIRINVLILQKHDELVQYLKEKYPEEFI